ncbi:MAG: hypothetical protein WKF57_03970 [Nakamurella sp.]
MSNQKRVQAGIPSGGQFSVMPRGESDISLDAGSADAAGTAEDQQVAPVVGAGLEPIAAAQARRELPAGSRVQVVYLNGQTPTDLPNPDVRTVIKQNAYEMVSAGPDGTRTARGSHLSWSGNKAERDIAGNIVISGPEGTPIVAYLPLDQNSAGDPDVEVRVPAVADLRDAKTSTDGSRLVDLAQNRLELVRATVASNPAASANELNHLVRERVESVSVAAALNPNTPSDCLAGALPNGGMDLHRVIAASPNADERTLGILIQSDDMSVGETAAANPNASRETLTALVERGTNPHLLAAVGRNLNAGDDNLTALANHDNHWVRRSVSLNERTPSPALDHLSGDVDADTRAFVARNSNTSAATLHHLAGDEREHVRKMVAENPRIRPETAQRLANDGGRSVRSGIAHNAATPAASVVTLLEDGDPFVRGAAASNPNLPEDRIRLASADESHLLRCGAASNPSCPQDVLEIMATADDISARHARTNLARRAGVS